jgi:hypothetical protein
MDARPGGDANPSFFNVNMADIAQWCHCFHSGSNFFAKKTRRK